MPAEHAAGFVAAGGVLGLQREMLRELLEAVLAKGVPFRFEARGHSMHPFIRDRDLVTVAPLPSRPLGKGEVVAFRHPEQGNLVLHRIREIRPEGLLVQGDSLSAPDAVIGAGELIGLVVRAERAGVTVYRGVERPSVGERVAWSGRQWLATIARHLAALGGGRSVPVADALPADRGGYAIRRPLFDLPQLQGKTERRVPHQFDLEVTARCNCDCRHCYVALPAADRAARATELTLPEIERIAGEAADLGALWCLITGGEPLLRDDFSDIYLALKRKGLLVSLFTNATLVGAEHVNLFRRYSPRDIEVTVYGATAETYERVTRRPGSFAAFERGLGLLLEGGIKVRLKAVAMRSNVHELADIARFCRERTKDYFRFDPYLTLRLDRDEGRNREILAERLGPSEIVALDRDDPQRFEALQTRCELLASGHDIDPNDRIFQCGAGSNGFFVAWDGTFGLCTSLRHPDTTFDLRRGSLRAAWEQVVPRVRDMRSRRAEFGDKCARCPIINLCQWCPAHADLESGELDACPESFCQVAHARARSLKPTTE